MMLSKFASRLPRDVCGGPVAQPQETTFDNVTNAADVAMLLPTATTDSSVCMCVCACVLACVLARMCCALVALMCVYLF